MFFVLGLLVIVALFKLGGGQRTVLVLAGGGAKGAWTVGVLKGLCKKDAYKDTWDTLSGTSIGAMNAGMLAQFPREQQCSHAVPELEKYWDSIQSVGDVWKRTDIPDVGMDLEILILAFMQATFFQQAMVSTIMVAFVTHRLVLRGTRNLWMQLKSATLECASLSQHHPSVQASQQFSHKVPSK